MNNYVFVESRDPFESSDTLFLAGTAAALKKGGNNVTMFLVQNGVLAARRYARKSFLPQLLESGVTVLADDFSVRERGIQSDEFQTSVKAASIDQLVDLIVQENTKAIWH